MDADYKSEKNFKVAISRMLLYILSSVCVFGAYIVIGLIMIGAGWVEESNFTIGNDSLNAIVCVALQIGAFFALFLTYFLHDEEYKTFFIRLDRKSLTPKQSFVAHLQEFGKFDLIWFLSFAGIYTIILATPTLATSGLTLAVASYAVFSLIPWLALSVPLWIFFNVGIYLLYIYLAHRKWHRDRQKLIKEFEQEKETH